MRNRTFLAILISLALLASAQDLPLLVTPSTVTLLVGESYRFRATGPDGRILTGVQWSISPALSADLQAGDEAEVRSTSPTEFEVVADYEGQRASAHVTVLAGDKLPPGTVRWGVKSLPGHKSSKIVRAVPTADGPGFYEKEVSPTGSIVRAVSQDGREMWRTTILSTPSAEIIGHQAESSSSNTSVCDSISLGAAKKEIAILPEAADYVANPPLFRRDEWKLEQQGSVCHVYFDSKGNVLRKRREITNQ